MTDAITYLDALDLKNPLFVDVRAPIEYRKDHIPGSINIPLFNDIERSIVGTLYKTRGRDEAVVRGSEFAGVRINEIISQIRGLSVNGDVVVNCYRGGMRSQSIVSLLRSLDIPVLKLDGGYKSYRKHVAERYEGLAVVQPAYVLHGLTGTGKTEILKFFRNSIDLEDLAGHRSSVFGGVGTVPKEQKMFESLLLKRLDDLSQEPYLIFEGESRKIGNNHIPPVVFTIINESPAILVTAPMERRIKILVDEYSRCDDKEEILRIAESLENRMGRRSIDLLRELFVQDKLAEFAQFLLEKYYDPLYLHTLKNMNYIAVVENLDTSLAAQEVERAVTGHLNRMRAD